MRQRYYMTGQGCGRRASARTTKENIRRFVSEKEHGQIHYQAGIGQFGK